MSYYEILKNKNVTFGEMFILECEIERGMPIEMLEEALEAIREDDTPEMETARFLASKITDRLEYKA